MKNKFQTINIGSSSILMIFIILCLVCFASLSLISSNADYSLSERCADKTIAYYQATNTAESNIASIDQTLHENASSLTRDEYFLSVGDSISFYVPINDQQSLFVDLETLYPDSESTSSYRLKNYQVVTLEPFEPDNSINFFTP